MNDLLTKLNGMPFQQIGSSLADMLRGASKVANSPDLTKSIAALQGVMASAQQVLTRVDAGVAPAMRELPSIARNLDATLTQASQALASANSGFGDNSRFRADLNRTILQLSDTARSVRVLADLLARHPEALIRGRTDRGEE